MIFKKTVTKREKKEAYKKKLFFSSIIVGLLILNFVLIYIAFLDKPGPILNPLSKNQISSTQIIEKKIKESGIMYESFTTGEDLTYILTLSSKSEVIIDSNKDIDEQISSLQLILKQLKIEGKALKRLDFRYQKPIITF